MRFLNFNNFKTIAALGTMVFFMSCTNEIATTTGGLINNDNFIKETISIQPILNTVIIDTVRTNLMNTYLLGEYTDSKLGTLKSSIVGEIAPISNLTEGVAQATYPLYRTTGDFDAIVTSGVEVTLELPLTLVNKEDSTEEFEINNLVGDIGTSLDITVSTFTTYLEEFNEDATSRIYYSDGTNNAGAKEELGNETTLGTKTGFVIKDTYTAADSLEFSLEIDLKTEYFENFLEDLDGLEINDRESFKEIFKGLKITSTNQGESLAIPFDLSGANLKIKFTNTNSESETEERELKFSFQGVAYNLYDHDHANKNESNKTYVQGAGGYETSIDISSFIDENSEKSLDENWLINQSKIKIYLDDVEDQTLQDFYLYGIENDGSLVIIDDYITLGVGAFSGSVVYEDTENETDPYIEFYITNFIREALAEGTIPTLRVKAREASDDTGLVLSSSIPNGALLLNDLSSDKAPELEVIYSKIE